VEQKKMRELGPGPLRVLPCVGGPVLCNYFTALRAEAEIDLLPVAVPAALPFRVRDDQPDAIVIVTEEFPSTAWRNSSSLREALSNTPTILLVGDVNASLKQRAARFHIRSTLPADVTTDQLLAAIRATVAGLAVTLEVFSRAEEGPIGWIATDERSLPESLTEHLTARETVVLRLMASGLGNKEIASRLDISEHTVKFHVSSVLAKLGVASRTEAVTIGIVRGLVSI
jgi:DNA-binding NarL/FixJ family response regulator